MIKKGEQEGVGAVTIGRIPLMLRSDRCVLKGKSEDALARLGASRSMHSLLNICQSRYGEVYGSVPAGHRCVGHSISWRCASPLVIIDVSEHRANHVQASARWTLVATSL